jgi:hypothetical protein
MQKQRGQIFLMTLLTLSTVLTAGVILITIFTRDLKLSSETVTSVKSLYAADSEVERTMYYKFKDQYPDLNIQDATTTSCMNPTKTPTTLVSACPIDCEKGSECIKATGLIGKISRGLEVDF